MMGKGDDPVIQVYRITPKGLARTTRARLLALGQVLRDEGKRDLGHLAPAVVDDERVPATGDLAEFGHGGVLLLPLEGGAGHDRGDDMVVLGGENQQRPALGVLRVDLSLGLQGLTLAVATWKIGLPGPGTEYFSQSSCASLSSTALAKAYRNCSKVSPTARP
jgi:hypothetical protein